MNGARHRFPLQRHSNDSRLRLVSTCRPPGRIFFCTVRESGVESQVMSSAHGILDLAEIHDRGQLSSAESYLVAASVQSLAERRVSEVETAVDRKHAQLIDQLQSLRFETADTGHCWTKTIR